MLKQRWRCGELRCVKLARSVARLFWRQRPAEMVDVVDSVVRPFSCRHYDCVVLLREMRSSHGVLMCRH